MFFKSDKNWLTRTRRRFKKWFKKWKIQKEAIFLRKGEKEKKEEVNGKRREW